MDLYRRDAGADDTQGDIHMSKKCVCTERRCGWKGMDTDMLSSANPFIPEETIYACPVCREIGSLVYACDEPECWQPVTCGTPVDGKYRNTCGKHAPKGTS